MHKIVSHSWPTRPRAVPSTLPPVTAQRVEFLVDRWFDCDFDDLWRDGVRIKRSEARNLRKALFGSVGLREVPDGPGAAMEFDLACGATLILEYGPRGSRFEDPSWVTLRLDDSEGEGSVQ